MSTPEATRPSLDTAPFQVQSFQVGKTPKDTTTLTVHFPTPFASVPYVYVTPFWEDSRSGVGYVETIVNIEPDRFTVVSSSAAPNYYLNWLAIVP